MKKSFFSRITGSSNDDYDYFDSSDSEQQAVIAGDDRAPRHLRANTNPLADTWQQEEPGGELAVDVYQTPDAIVVKAFIAGVQPTSLDISLTREMVTISGTRQDEREAEDDNYYQKELYWGSFSRTILLPEEVDVDTAEASEKHGILIIRLPKINKNRQAKLKVRVR
jgi:HSP20 family protein